MTNSSRVCVIAGNWKMYKTIDQALSFMDQIIPIAETAHCQILLAVPFTAIKTCADKAKGTKIVIGAQNMNDASEGAFTGEVAASMLKDAGASFVIIGHSERRKHFGETNELINKKVKRALSSDLTALLCVGETFDEREAGKAEAVLKEQLTAGLAGVAQGAVKNKLMLAYEPVWAIGTGIAATAEIAEKMQTFCRHEIETLLGGEAAKNMPILYGGSVTADNAAQFLGEPDVDGLLIGSASLQPESFAKIIKLRHNAT